MTSSIRAQRDENAAALREEIVRLGPWHVDIEVMPGLSTRAFLDSAGAIDSPRFEGMAFIDPREGYLESLGKVYPDGLEGRSVLDCACNCGAYLFWAKELGAGRCFGFDVREHWIEQARFLAKHRTGPGEDVSFEVLDLYDLPKLGLERFDVTLFNGIFYHLPDPITGLKIAAQMTSELMIVNTAVKRGYPQGLLVASDESTTHAMSGVYGLHWFPSGPRVVTAILNWLGFPETRCSWWSAVPDQQEPGLDRMQILASRRAGLFERFDQAKGPRWREVLRNTIPPEATVLVAQGEDAGASEPLRIHGREARPFPDDEDGAASTPGSATSEAIAELEEQRARGADYLVLAGAAGQRWLERDPDLARHLEGRYRVAAQEAACIIFDLNEEPARPHTRA